MFLSFLMGCALLLTGPLLRIHLIFIFSLSAGDGHCGLMTIGANAAEPNTKHGKMTLGYSVNPWCLYYRQRQISAQMCRVTRKIVQRKWAQHGTTVTSHGKLEGRNEGNDGRFCSRLFVIIWNFWVDPMGPFIGHGMHLESTYAPANQGLVPLQDWFLVVDKRPEELLVCMCFTVLSCIVIVLAPTDLHNDPEVDPRTQRTVFMVPTCTKYEWIGAFVMLSLAMTSFVHGSFSNNITCNMTCMSHPSLMYAVSWMPRMTRQESAQASRLSGLLGRLHRWSSMHSMHHLYHMDMIGTSDLNQLRHCLAVYPGSRSPSRQMSSTLQEQSLFVASVSFCLICMQFFGAFSWGLAWA